MKKYFKSIIVSILVYFTQSKNIGVQTHNEYRYVHCTKPLFEDRNLTKIAQVHANYLLKNNLFEHGHLYDYSGRRIGQNLYVVWNSVKNDSEIIKMAIKRWYKESNNYNYQNSQYRQGTGHFTQLIWNSTNTVGIAISKGNNKHIVVADYFPPGNVNGKFKDNVFPLCK